MSELSEAADLGRESLKTKFGRLNREINAAGGGGVLHPPPQNAVQAGIAPLITPLRTSPTIKNPLGHDKPLQPPLGRPKSVPPGTLHSRFPKQCNPLKGRF